MVPWDDESLHVIHVCRIEELGAEDNEAELCFTLEDLVDPCSFCSALPNVGRTDAGSKD
jgi:hypothetical protein